jgi:hypothetical protein
VEQFLSGLVTVKHDDSRRHPMIIFEPPPKAGGSRLRAARPGLGST